MLLGGRFVTLALAWLLLAAVEVHATSDTYARLATHTARRNSKRKAGVLFAMAVMAPILIAHGSRKKVRSVKKSTLDAESGTGRVARSLLAVAADAARVARPLRRIISALGP